MTIKFVCGCGKHLRAHDSMARVRVLCPSCGSLVGVPSLEPNVPGGGMPMTPQERLRHARDNPTPLLTLGPDLPDGYQQKELVRAKRVERSVRLHIGKGPRPRSNRNLEQFWYECLGYPLRAWRLCLALALVLTGLSVGLLVWVPRILNDPTGGGSWMAARNLTWVLPALLVAGLPCSFFDRVLASAAGGEVDYVLWSGNILTTFLLAGAKWLACFLAGPAALAAIGWLYWIRCGETSWVDLFILGEVAIVGVAYFILAVTSVADRGRWRDLNPLAVADLAHRLRWRVMAVLAGALGFLVLGLFLIASITKVHRDTIQGGLLLTCGWFVAVFLGTFYARLLGIWCHRTRTPESA